MAGGRRATVVGRLGVLVILVVRVKDKLPKTTDPKLYFGRPHRGDVIETLPDDHQFSPRELTNPEWRFLRVPLVRAEGDALQSPELNPAHTKLMTWRRLRKLDLDSPSIPVALKAFLDDDTRKAPVMDVGKTMLLSLVQVKDNADLSVVKV